MHLAKLSVVQTSTEWAMARFLAVWTWVQSRLAISFPRHLLLFALPGVAIGKATRTRGEHLADQFLSIGSPEVALSGLGCCPSLVADVAGSDAPACA